LLINPPGISLGYNVGLCYLTANLKKHGFKVKIVDFLNQPGNEDERLLLAKDYDVVGLSIKTLVLDEAVRIMNKVKRINEKAAIICGGVHLSLDAANFMKEYPVCDVAFQKDSEESIVEFMKGKNLAKIDGAVYREDGEIIVNPKSNLLTDLDELPFPDFDSFDRHLREIGNYPLLTSRGCPYSCIYCTVQVVSKRWKPRAVENLITELKQNRHRIKEFHIVDDNFTLRIDRIKEFCRRLIDEKMGLRWSCPNGIRADIMDEELVSLMRKSGCYLANLGIESADEAVFKTINKGESLSDVIQAVKMLKKEGIIVIGNFILGLPGSTYRIDMESVRKAKEMGLDVSLWYPLSLYPKTKVYDLAINDSNLRFIRDWKKGFKYNFKGKPILSFERRDYRKEEMIKAFFLANLKSRSYGILIDPKKNLVVRAIDLLKIILKYDPLYIFSHSYNAFKILISFRKVY